MQEFDLRREKLFSLMKDNSVAVIFSGVSKVATEDELYPFQVNNSFFYLTGISQEHSVLLMIKGLGERKCYLFIFFFSKYSSYGTARSIIVPSSFISITLFATVEFNS